tara:strand:- start:72 stop:1031 length:960 start_codon:yes stop_codon:yes gene_type:complete
MPLGASKTGLMGSAGTAAAGARAIFGPGEGATSTANVVDYVEISTLNHATDFGDYPVKTNLPGGDSNGSNDRGVFSGGYLYNGSWSSSNVILYFTISAGSFSSTNFGDLTAGRAATGSCSNKTDERMVIHGDGSYTNILEYITVNSASNSLEFGDLTVIRNYTGEDSNGTSDRAVFAGGRATPLYNVIDYITITSTGDATDFGDLTSQGGYWPAACSNLTNDRVVFSGGSAAMGDANQISYITITSTGDSAEFGDLYTNVAANRSGTSNGTDERGIIVGGDTSGKNVIQYITINSASNSQDFGDITEGRAMPYSLSNAG